MISFLGKDDGNLIRLGLDWIGMVERNLRGRKGGEEK